MTDNSFTAPRALLFYAKGGFGTRRVLDALGYPLPETRMDVQALGSQPEKIYPPCGWITTLHFGRVAERSSRVAMGRKAAFVRRTPVSYTWSSKCTMGETPRHVIDRAQAKVVPMEFSRLPFQWFSKMPQHRSIGLYLL